MARQPATTNSQEFADLHFDELNYRIEKTHMTDIRLRIVKKKEPKQESPKGKKESRHPGRAKNQNGSSSEEDGSESATGQSSEDEYEDDFCEIVSEPDIRASMQKLREFVAQFEQSLSSIKRIENIIYPLLCTERKFLAQPKPSAVKELHEVDLKIQWLITQAQDQALALQKKMSRFLVYYSMTEEQMLRDLKVMLYRGMLEDEKK